MSFKHSGIHYVSKPTNHLGSTYSDQSSRPGLATLLEAHSWAKRLDIASNIENIKALWALCKHCKYVEQPCAYTDVLAAVRPPPTLSTSHVEEVPDVSTQVNTQDNHPKKTTIF